ncbi:MetQ/NlpA family ABC transporter substrate-binding protein [Oenococcus alcoholitolerans]|uniref:MetQ/NlpA family ABC transporter substrate-binding protein n=1 Tax=Oenococcus alcoholitolerans TaxID=931074 RepID=UPI003F6F8AED
MKRNTKWFLSIGVVVILLVLVFSIGIGASRSSNHANGNLKTIRVGVAPGPYGDMAKNIIGPLLKRHGYQVRITEFNDYIQPNKALNSGEINANLFQHRVYLQTFSQQNHLKLTAMGTVPTLGMGIYSNRIKSLNALHDGATVSLANDPSNLARSLQLLAANHLITLKNNINAATASISDIAANPHRLVFKTLDAAQLPQSRSNVDLALIPGNFAWNAKIRPSSALALEKLQESYKNVFVVKTDQKNSAFAKAVRQVLNSNDFRQRIADSQFKDFAKPNSWR